LEISILNKYFKLWYYKKAWRCRSGLRK